MHPSAIVALAAAIVLPHVAHAVDGAAKEATIDSKFVARLNKDNFGNFVKDETVKLVEFYAPCMRFQCL